MALKAHLETNTLQVEGRRQKRRALRLETSGGLPGGIEANVTVHNISPAGLLLESEAPLEVGEVLAIDLPRIGPVGAEIVWQSGHLSGCAFQQALGEAALAAVQLRSEAPRPGTPTQSAPTTSTSGLRAAETLGYRINRKRRERGLTLAQVASALEVSKPTVWAWEKDKARPIPERLGAIAEVLGVSEAELIEDRTRAAGSALIEDCRLRIATAYGTSPNNIRIMIEV